PERQLPRNDSAPSDGVGRPPLTHEANGCKGAKGGTDAERKTRGAHCGANPFPTAFTQVSFTPQATAAPSCVAKRGVSTGTHGSSRRKARCSAPKNAGPHRRTRNRTAKHDAPGGACAAPDFYNGTATIRLCTLLSWAEPTVHPRRHHEGSSMRIRTVLATLAATAVAAVTIPMAAQAAPGNT